MQLSPANKYHINRWTNQLALNVSRSSFEVALTGLVVLFLVYAASTVYYSLSRVHSLSQQSPESTLLTNVLSRTFRHRLVIMGGVISLLERFKRWFIGRPDECNLYNDIF